MAFLENGNQKLEPEPRKTGINNDMVVILISCDPKGNLIAASFSAWFEFKDTINLTYIN